MATGSKVNVEINVTAPGLNEANKGATQLHNTLKGAATAAQQVRVPGAVAAARQGVAASSTARLAAAAPDGTASATNLSRGIAGATGAEGRDFAKQARGLGGLVHVYATFAANLFAVSAAFGVLKAAADTSNMVKGLDQLGAASGVALGSLSKRLVKAADGAISLREGMEATAKAVASGMDSSQLLRMGDSAKKASQALGVDMSDAVSRLSRGITKLEPELLDELGIFVRIDDVTRDYAASVGKAASALTDFERRQAFANAVLDQAQRKFGAIELDANPYAKLLASMKDVAQTGLELVNKVLGPIVKLISESPAGLALAMTAIGGILLKQAIPALGAFRKNAKEAAEEALKLANDRNKAAAEAGVEGAKRALTAENKLKIEMIKKSIADEIKALEIGANDKELAAEKAAIAVKSKLQGSLGKSTLKILDKEASQVTDKEMALLARNVERAQVINDRVSATDSKASESAKKVAKDRLEGYEAVLKKTKEAKDAQVAQNVAEETSGEKQKKMLAEIADIEANSQRVKAKYWSVEAAAQRTADAANKAALSRSIVANAGEKTRVEGLRAAYVQLNQEIAKARLEGGSTIGDIKVPQFSMIAAGFTRIKGLINIATTAVEVFGAALNKAFFIIGIITTAYSILNGLFSSNSKQTAKFAEDLGVADEAADSLSRTLSNISKKDPLAVFSIASIKTKATALHELTSSMSSMVDSFAEARKAASGWDKAMDALWDSVGRGSADKLSSNLAKSVSRGLLSISDGPTKAKAIKSLEELFGKNIDFTNIKEFDKALRKLDNQEIQGAGAKISKLFKDISLDASNAASTIETANTKLEELSKLVQAQNQKLVPTDDISKLGMSMISAAEGMTNALKSPIESMTLLGNIIKDVRLLSLVSPGTSSALIKHKQEIEELNASYSSLQAGILESRIKLQELKDKGITGKVTDEDKAVLDKGRNLGVSPQDANADFSFRRLAQFDESIAYLLEKSLSEMEAQSAAEQVKMKAAAAEFTTKVNSDLFTNGLKNLSTGLNKAMEEGAITATKGYLSALKQAGVSTADAEAKLRAQELSIQREAVEVTYRNIKAHEATQLALDKASLEIEELANNIALSSKSDVRIQAALDKAPALEKRRKDMTQRESGLGMSAKELTALASKVGANEGTSEARTARINSTISPAVLQSMMTVISSSMAYLAAMAKIGGQAEANRFTDIVAKEQEDVKKKKEALDVTNKQNTTKLESLRIAQDTSHEYSSHIQLEKDALEIAVLKNNSYKEYEDIQSNLNILDKIPPRKGDTQKLIDERKDARNKLNQAEYDRAEKLSKDEASLILKQLSERQKGENDNANKREEYLRQERDSTSSLNLAKLSSQEQQLSYLKEIQAISDKQLAIQSQEISMEKLTIEYVKTRAELTAADGKKLKEIQDAKDRAINANRLADTSGFDKQAAGELANQKRISDAADLKFQTDIQALTRKTSLDIVKSQQELADKKAALAATERSELESLAQARLSHQQQHIDYLTTVGVMSAEENIRASANIALKQEELSFAKQSADLKAKEASEVSKWQVLIDQQRGESDPAGNNGPVNPETIAQLNAVTDSYARQNALLVEGNAARVNTIKLTSEHKSLMEQMGELTRSLTTVFGELGTTIGGVGKAILDMSISDAAFAKERLDIQQKLSAIEASGDTAGPELIKQKIDLDKKQAKSEIANIGAVAGASKKMFKEKTGAYKVINAVEKASSLASLAITFKETALKIASWWTAIPAKVGAEAAETGATAAGFASRLPTYIKEIYASWGKMGPWMVGAASLFIASMLGGGSKSSSVNMAGLTSADRQEVQGTGQAFVNGKKVDTGGGVFGDSSAKSESIVNSLEIMKANSIVGLDYDKSMLKALQKLADSIVGAAKSLYSVPGLRAGTGFGTSEGSTAGGRGGVLGSVFGGKTTSTTSIESAGLQFRGTFDTLMNSITTSVVQYKDVLTQYTKSGGWFKKDKAWSTLSRETKALEEGVSASISDIFKDANELFLELGRKTSVTASTIQSTLKTFNTSFDIDLKGLTGDALIAELNGVIGGVLSEAAGALFKGFEMFREFGEDYLQTVLRVVDGNNKVSQALISMGNAFSVLSKFNVSEVLIENAGGLEAFMDQTSFFKEKFLTAAEQLAPVQRAVSQQLVNLGLSATTTADQFKGLVLAQDLSTKTGQDMFQSLMELAPGFVAVQEASEGTKSSLSKLIIELLQLQGKTAEALALTRKEELDALSDSEKVIKLQIYALQDEKSLREKILSLRDKEKSALESTLNTLNKYIDSLEAQKIALLGGTISTLTPQQKYDEAQRRQQELAQRAQGPATTAAELTARNKALDELPAANTAFLESSRMLFASSETYARDFASVINTIDSTSALLELQKTDTELQLEQLQASTAFLDAISQSTETMSSLLAEYLLNQDRFITAQNYVPNLAESLASALTVTAPIVAHANAVALTGTTAADNAIATDTASAYLGITAPTGNISTLDTAGAGDATTSDAGFSTSAERASYYADNPTMAAVTSFALDAFGYTSLGIAINALTEGIAVQNAKAETTGVSITAVADTNITATDLAVMADSISVYGGNDSSGAGAGAGPQGGNAGLGGGSVAFAKGGLAHGFSLVGEEGPEFVDFQSPGRVYTAQQTQGMFANNTQIQQQLIQEVQNLRKELTTLREQQSKETGHLITATYDASMKAADKVAAATEDAANQSDWASRSAVKIA